MKAYTGARPPPTWDGDFGPTSATDAPECRRRAVTQHRAWAASQHGRHPKAAPRHEAPADDRVDASVDATQPTDPDSVVDRVASKAKL